MNKVKLILMFTIFYIIITILVCTIGVNILNQSISQHLNSNDVLFAGETQISPQIALIIMVALYLIIIGKVLETKPQTKQGSAKIESVSTLRDIIGKDGVRLSKNVKLKLQKTFEHILVLGPTGAGKSSSIYIPNMLELEGQTSVLVTDPKEEIYSISKSYLLSKGYRIIRLKPLATEEEYENDETLYRFNLIKTTDDITELKEISQLIMMNSNKSYEIATGSTSNNAEWLAMATPLLTAGIIYGNKNKNVSDFNEIVDLLLLESDEVIGKKVSYYDESYKEFMIYLQSAGSPQTSSSIKVTLSNALQIFNDSKIQNFIRGTKKKQSLNIEDEEESKQEEVSNSKERYFNPEMLREKPTALFLHVPERKALYLMPLISVITQITLNKVLEVKGMPIVFFLDEFANIGVIPSIANICATARSRKIGLVIALQSIEQLNQNYGENNASIILSNLKTTVAYKGLKEKSSNYISNLCGYTTIETESISYEDGSLFNTSSGKKNKTVSEQKRELLTHDEVRRLDDDKLLIIVDNKNPVIDKMIKYYKEKKYLKKIPKEVLAELQS